MMLEVDGIDTYYGETQALFGVSLSVDAGEVVALLGPNGAGKTTTLRSILGLTPARDGAHPLRRARHHARCRRTTSPRRGIGWVPDDRRIFPTLTVARNLSIARKKTRFRAWTEKECFEIFSALEYLMHRECENLSGGEMQMVAISRALLGAPGLVLFDEPSQGLAPKVVQDVMRTILRLKSEGVAILVVEQNVQSALAVADRVYVMNHGTDRPPRPARASSWPTPRCASACWAPDAWPTPAALHVDALAKRYTRGALRPHDDVLRWRPTSSSTAPTVVGVMGPNGSGKTTLFELITGSNLPTSGRVRSRGRTSTASATASATGWRSITTSRTRSARSSARGRRSCWNAREDVSPLVHLFDEPQFNAQDGYIGFMLDFFRRAARTGKLVFLCLHPNEPYHIDILRETCERFIFVDRGRLTHAVGLRIARAAIPRSPPISAG